MDPVNPLQPHVPFAPEPNHLFAMLPEWVVDDIADFLLFGVQVMFSFTIIWPSTLGRWLVIADFTYCWYVYVRCLKLIVILGCLGPKQAQCIQSDLSYEGRAIKVFFVCKGSDLESLDLVKGFDPRLVGIRYEYEENREYMYVLKWLNWFMCL